MTTATVRARRNAIDLARGAAALVVVLVLLVSIPVALLTVAGSPLPRALPSPDEVQTALTTPDDGRLFLQALGWAAWAGWATFAVALLVETVAQLRGREPLRLPALGPQQHIARTLVTSIAVVVSTPVMIALPPALATTAAAPAPTATAPLHLTRALGATTGAAAGAPGPGSPPPEVLVVPGDTLSGIAEHHLGDAGRYPEIAQESSDVVQPDGRRLVDPDLIYPGWRVHLPVSTDAAVPQPPPSTADGRAPDPGPTPSLVPDPAPTTADESETGHGDADPRLSGDRTPCEPTAGRTDTAAAGDDDSTSDIAVVSAATGLGALTAAGLVALMARKRARRQRHRRRGQRLAVPGDAARAVERHLRSTQDPLTAADLDRALRALADHCHRVGAPLPAVRLARVLDHRIELHLATPAAPAPPFTAASQEDTLWTLERDSDQESTAAAPDAAPPFPALTSIGRDLDGGTVLVNLEEIGALTVSGPAPDAWGEHGHGHGHGHWHSDSAAQAVLAGMAVELATCARADDLEVTLVGLHPDLAAALDVSSLGHTDDVERLLVELDAWASGLRLALLSAGLDSPSAARSTQLVPEAWVSRVILLGTQLTAPQAESLHLLLTEEPRVPLAVVTTTPRTPEGWRLTTHRDANLATLEPESLTVVPQALPADAHRLVTEMLLAADAAPVTPAPVVDRAASAAGPHGHEPSALRDGMESPGLAGVEPPTTAPAALDEDAEQGGAAPSAAAPMVRVLGPVEITGAQGTLRAETHRARITELVAFMALHPHRDHYLLDEALWPGDRVPDGRRNQLLSRARHWLGADSHGQPYVPIVSRDGYRLDTAVGTDWSHFLDLVGHSPSSASDGDLHAALALIRGQPFTGANPVRYAWADIDRQEMIAAIVDASHEAALRAQRDGDAASARRAAAIGLLTEPGSELLWRDALRAEWLAGDRAGLETMAGRLTVLAEELGDDLEAETLDLLDQLLRPPSAQRSAVTVAGGSDDA